MEKEVITFGAKLVIAPAFSASSSSCSPQSGCSTLGNMEDSAGGAVNFNARKLDLAGRLNAEESDMAVGQRGIILFTFAKNAAGVIGVARRSFRNRSAVPTTASPTSAPSSTRADGKELIADIDRRMAEWMPAYAELRRLAQAGDPDGAIRVLTERITAALPGVGTDAAELAKTFGGRCSRSTRRPHGRPVGYALAHVCPDRSRGASGRFCRDHDAVHRQGTAAAWPTRCSRARARWRPRPTRWPPPASRWRRARRSRPPPSKRPRRPHRDHRDHSPERREYAQRERTDGRDRAAWSARRITTWRRWCSP